MPITKTFNNTSYSIPLEGELNWATLSNFLVALADYSQTINKQKVGMRVAIATPVTVLATTDCVIVTDLTTPGAVAVNLPAGVSGQVFTVVDGKGDAGTNNITITPAAGTINGAATYVIDSNRAGVSLAYNGTSWTVIAEFISSGDIPRNQIAAGTASHVVINDGSGDLSSEAALAASRGGLATDASAFSGYVKSAAGVFSAGSIAAGDLPASIDATKIADGSVTNTEFQYINTLTSNAQTQISDRVVGAASSTDNALARFDLATGKVIQNSGIIVDDSNNVTGVNDLTVTGDLTVNGATVTVNTATLDVEDTNITVNKGGNDASSAGAGITVDRTGTKGSIIYNNAAVSKFKVGDLASEVEIATISGAQVLTAKDIDGGTASNTSRITIPKDTKTNLDALTRKEGTLVYASDLDKLYADDGSSLKEIGSGGSGINYLADYFSAETLGTVGTALVGDTDTRNTSNFSAWQSTNTANISLSVSSTNPLRTPKCFLFTGSGNAIAGTTFVESPAFQLHVADLGKPVSVNFDIADVTADGNFDVIMVRYNSSGAYQEKISIAGNASGANQPSAKLPTGISKFNGFFIASSTSTDYYALRFRRLAGTDVPRLDSIKISPEQVIQGAAPMEHFSWSSGLQNISTTAGATDNFANTGTVAISSSVIAISGPSSGTYTLTFNRIGKYKLNLNLYHEHANAYGSNFHFERAYGGTATLSGIAQPAASSVAWGIDAIDSNVQFSENGIIDVTLIGQTVTINIQTIYGAVSGSTANHRFYGAISIFGDNGTNVTMANRAVEEYASNSSTTDADDTTSFAYGNLGSQFGNFTAERAKRVKFQTPILSTDKISVEITTDGGLTWVPIGDGASTFQRYTYQNTTSYGIGWAKYDQPTGIIVVYFGKYRDTTNTTYGTAGAPWSDVDVDNQFKWRVRKVSGGASVGFPISARNVVGDVSGTTVPSGYIGEKISVTLTPSTLTGSYADVSPSLTLTKGVWMIYAAFTLNKTAHSTAYCIFKLRDTTTPTDMYLYSWGTQSTATAMFSPHTIAVYVNHSNTRSYVLQAYDPNNTSAVTFASNTGGVYGQQEFFAIRIA